MADNEYEDIAAQIMAEKGIGDFSSLDEIIDGRYFFVHGEWPTERGEAAPTEEGGQAFGKYIKKARGKPDPLRNIRLSNTRMPSKSMKKYSPVVGDAVEPADETEERTKSSAPDKSALLGALFSGGGDASKIAETVQEETDKSYPKGWRGDGEGNLEPDGLMDFGVNPDLSKGQAGVPWMQSQRTANRDLAKLYALLDEGKDYSDPMVQELYAAIEEDLAAMAIGGSEATGGITDTQKALREQMGP